MLLKERRLPSYPLFVKDPFFSFWLPADDPTSADVAFWHGEKKPIVGIVKVDGVPYRFLGKGEEKPLRLESTEITSFATTFCFSGDGFAFRVTALSPLPPDDLDVLSLPVTYLDYSFESGSAHDVEVELYMEERAAYDTCFNEDRKARTRINRFVLNTCECAGIGLIKQAPLSNSFDEVGADWGYYYLCGERAGAMYGERDYIFAKNFHANVKSADGFFAVAFDDIVSVFYYGEYLKNYWQRDGRTVFDAVNYAYCHKTEIYEKCKKFDDKLVRMCAGFSDDYLFVLYASLRQSLAAHKLVADGKGRILFLSKECNSDGCIATVDITYPSMPLYLLFNPALVRGMAEPILDFARMPVWKYDFAPHDAGIYPYCFGQYYAIQDINKEKCVDLAVRDWKESEVLPFYYQLPQSCELYDPARQMPVEESGNMLAISLLYYMVSGDKAFIKDNYDLLSKWVKYLVDFGLVPANQLCTDDFAGHLDKNANLAVKAIVGIYCFARISAALGKKKESVEYEKTAVEYARKWCELYNDGDHTVLTYGNESTYSLKYNMAIDSLLGGKLFSDALVKRELEYYKKVAGKYGVALDSRDTCTKSDWLMWVAAMGDESTCAEYSRYLADFMTDTPDRVPFSDLYYTTEPKYRTFRNRTVQGGNFFPMLKRFWSEICKVK